MDVRSSEVTIPAGDAELAADLLVPAEPNGVVLFAHGSGSSRHSPRNTAVAHVLNRDAFGTVQVDLLTPAEDRVDVRTAELRFDIELLAGRLAAVVDWLAAERPFGRVPIGLFGASTGAAAALRLAAEQDRDIAAVVSRGGRPDLAGRAALGAVRAPTLLIVGGDDDIVIGLNRSAMAELNCEAELVIIPGATHLFEEAGALEQVAEMAAGWFENHFPAPSP